MKVDKPKAFFEKVWTQNVVANLGENFDLLHVDRNFIHDLSGARALSSITEKKREVRYPNLTFACPDHTVSTDPNASHEGQRYDQCIRPLQRYSLSQGIKYFNFDDDNFGIIHIIGPELGLTLPGLLIVCGDSHTCTHGGLGALAWGIGASEVEHVLATGTVVQKKPKTLKIKVDGKLANGVVAKDLVLHIIASQGVDIGVGYAIEFDGTTIRNLNIENRMTICNMSIEMGAKIGMVAPDDTTFEYLSGRSYSPTGRIWDQAVENWGNLKSDLGSTFDKEFCVDVDALEPQISWGINPEHTVSINGQVPNPLIEENAEKRRTLEAAIKYSKLEPGTHLENIPIDRVFIGSCTNSRLDDLLSASALANGRTVAENVEAWVVPGSRAVKREAESLGIDRVFKKAGFQWREPGCSMCVGSNGELVAEGMRCVSTSNRNFVGRQGKGSHTHLASPLTAVASAIAGQIADPRKLM